MTKNEIRQELNRLDKMMDEMKLILAALYRHNENQ